MKRSEQCDQLYAALALARANFGTAERTKEAKIKGKSKMSGESFEYKYKYAPLEECFKAIDQALSDQGLALVGGVEYSADGQMWVITHLGHTSGQWIENALNCGIPQDDKDMGGKITYARRYGVTLTVQMQAEDDDDGPRGEEAHQERRLARKPTPKPSQSINGVDGALHPTADQINALVDLARSVGVNILDFGHDVRRIMNLEPGAAVTKKFLRDEMRMAQFESCWAHYLWKAKRLNEESTNYQDDDRPLPSSPDAPESPEPHEPSVGNDIPAGGHEDVATGLVDGLQDNIGNSEGVEVEHDDLASSTEVERVRIYADSHALGKVLMQSLSHYPHGIPQARLDDIEQRLKDRVAAQEKAAKV